MIDDARTSITVEDLRAEFDSRFSQPPQTARARVTGLLLLAVDRTPLAIRASEVLELAPDRQIRPFPDAASTVRGFARLGCGIVVVHSLAAILGCPGRPDEHWLVAAAREPGLALSFDTFERYCEADVDGLRPRGDASSARHVSQIYHDGSIQRAVIDLESVLSMIKKQGSSRETQR